MSIISADSVLKEIHEISKNTMDLTELFESINELTFSLNEAEYNKVTSHLRLELLNIERFIKVDNLQVVSNPRAFAKANIPSDDGILSYKIFGNTMEERSNIFAYIDLNGYFIDPSCYKAWIRIDSKVRDVVHKVGTYSIDAEGNIVEDPAGKNGVKFLKANINKIKFKSTESIKRDLKVKYLEMNRNKMFINKYIVIPPYYRDANTGKRSVGVGGINKLYSQLIMLTNSLSASQDYGFDLSGPTEGRIQEVILAIYD